MRIAQADIALAYDPLEENAKTTPLGQPYDGRQVGYGNAWGSWHHLIPTRKIAGWGRIYATTWLTEGFRVGMYEGNYRATAAIDLPAKGLVVTACRGELWKDGQQIGGADTPGLSGPFDRGTFLTLRDPGGAVVLAGNGDGLVYEYSKGNLTLYYRPATLTLAAGDVIHYTVRFAGAGGQTTTEALLDFARKFGVFTPGTPGYQPHMIAGTTRDTSVFWHTDAAGASVQARIAKTAMPGFLTACVDGLNDHWSVWLLDKARTGPNVRALPIRDGRAWAQLDLCAADSDLFIGHPVTTDNPAVVIAVGWRQEGQWTIEAHNPTEKPLTTRLTATPGWTPFTFHDTVTLPAGSSRVWTVQEKK